MDVPIFLVEIRCGDVDSTYTVYGTCSSTIGNLVQPMIVGMVAGCES